MEGTHTLEELRSTKGFHMRANGIVSTRYGRSTTNYWKECSNGKYVNFDCKTVY